MGPRLTQHSSHDLRQQRRVVLDALPCHLDILRVELDQDSVTAQSVGHKSGRAYTREGVEDHAGSDPGVTITARAPSQRYGHEERVVVVPAETSGPVDRLEQTLSFLAP